MKISFLLAASCAAFNLLISPFPAEALLGSPTSVNVLDDGIRQMLSSWEVPGVAVAVVKDDRVVFSKGYGTTAARKGEPVTADTLFALGSISKSLTAAALAMLVDEGKINWDDPVTDYLPRFQLHDPYLAQQLTIKDLLTHRVGLAENDGNLLLARFQDDELLERIAQLSPVGQFRSSFAYQNVLYIVAGKLLEAVTGQTWDDFVQNRLLKPLGMTASRTSPDAVRDGIDLAKPFVKGEQGVTQVELARVAAVGPAGGLVSNVNDMAQYVRLMLAKGVHQGRQLISEQSINTITAPTVVVPLTEDYAIKDPYAHILTYGLGWYIHEDRGYKIVQHRGRFPGYTARITLVPDQNLGVVVLTNLEKSLAADMLCYEISDRFLGRQGMLDWSSTFAELDRKREQNALAAQQQFARQRVVDTKPSLELAEYAASYSHPVYGEASVEQEDGKLVFKYGKHLIGDLSHWHYDSFLVTWRDPLVQVNPGNMIVNFALNHDAQVGEMQIGDQLAFMRNSAAQHIAAGD